METPHDYFNEAITAAVTALLSAIGAAIARKLEKRKLRKQGKLND